MSNKSRIRSVVRSRVTKWSRLLFLIASILLLAAEAQAATYYVRPNGNDDGRGKSSRRAFRTIKKAASVAGNGDLVLVAPGNYTDTVNIRREQSSRRLEFRATDPGKVVISGQVNVVDSNHVVFTGFQFAGNAERFLVWQGSYDGTLANCKFLGGRQALLMTSGSLTLDECELVDFTSDGIQIDGEAKLTIKKSRISGCTGSAISMLKNAGVVLDDSNLIDNTGDGIHVEVVSDTIPVTGGSCECTGTSPLSMKRDAYALLANVTPQTAAYRQAISEARSAINSSLNSRKWKDGWHVTVTAGPKVYEKSKEAIEKLHAVFTDDIDFLVHPD